MADFSKSIDSLRARARNSKRIVKYLGVGIFILVFYAFTFIVYRYTIDSSSKNKSIFSFSQFADFQTHDLKSIIVPRIQQVLNETYGPLSQGPAWASPENNVDKKAPIPTKEQEDQTKQKIEMFLGFIEKFKEAPHVQQQPSSESQWAPLASSIALSVGAIALIILILQIAVTFMRYYARLAELYEAQADALEAAEGDPELAYQFIEKFSPLAVDFGKLPITLYEKSFDAVLDIAKMKK